METLIYIIIISAVFGFIGMALGDLGGKAQGPAGFLCGALLGPLGCVIAVLLPPAAGKAAAAAPGPDAQTQRKIAAMEAQLAALKAGPKVAAKPLKKANDDDSPIPTYSLD